ncbi:hypothetical protein SynROS8604_02121 [Synechococcus sp. ROS8604]|nr:hypothetical protein SynROS8604_02121 [Synechococcus sp. ROS8604]
MLTSMAGIIAEQEAKALRQFMDSPSDVSREDFLSWASKQPGLGWEPISC